MDECAYVIVVCDVIVVFIAIACILFLQLPPFYSAEFCDIVHFSNWFIVENTDVTFFDYRFLDVSLG